MLLDEQTTILDISYRRDITENKKNTDFVMIIYDNKGY